MKLVLTEQRRISWESLREYIDRVRKRSQTGSKSISFQKFRRVYFVEMEKEYLELTELSRLYLYEE